jgi:hypothetical protein
MYKINDDKKINDLNDSLLNYISENIDYFNNIIKENYPTDNENIISDYNKQIINKIYKIQTKFSLITKKNIEDTKELLKIICDNNTDWSFTLKYESTPIFILESSSENSTQENHDLFLELLQEKSKIYNIQYNKIN